MTSLGTEVRPLKVAVVGSGPSGFYAAEALIKSEHHVQVNMIEKLPAPFGLVRYGVAPDHPKLKQVNLLFHKIAQDPDIHFYGNLEVGKDLSVDELKSTHHAVIFCSGAETDRRLGIPGEDLAGSHTATEFVAWYNGHPAYRDYKFDLSNETAVIIGQGNVAADVCRILAKSVDDLRKTDITEHALDLLATSRIRQIHVVGRRGPAQAKFTNRELKELVEIPDCTAIVNPDELALNPQDTIELADKANDNAARSYETFQSLSKNTTGTSLREIYFHFLLSPLEIKGEGKVESITFSRNLLTGKAFNQSAQATESTTQIDCGLCFRSIGYLGQGISGAPLNSKRGVIPNEKGRVINNSGEIESKLYTSGWIKRGPTGVIGTNRADSVETVATLLDDLPGLSSDNISSKTGEFAALVAQKNIHFVSYDDWCKIDAAEIERGNDFGKPREKFVDVTEMLAVLRNG